MSRPAWINVGPQESIGVATVTASNDTLTLTSHGLADGDIVMVDSLTGGAVGPLISGAVYFVRNVSGDDFQLSGTRGSQLKEFATDGTAEVFSAVPQYHAPDLRRNDSVLLWGGTADPLGSRAGVRPHSTPIVTVAGTTWSVNEHSGVVYPAVTTISAAYRYHQLDQSGSTTAAHGSLDRMDALDLEVQDHDEDGSGFRRSRVVYTAGTAAGSPTAPTLVAGRLRLATILVPAGGTPAPTVASLAQYTVASGGILPTRSGEALPTAGLVAGTYGDQDGALQRWDGTGWAPVASPSSPEIVVFTSSGSFSKASYPWGRRVVVEVQGGGGGGGGAATTAAGAASTGSGGGGGGYARESIDFASLASSETVTVGSGGSGGAAGDNDGGTGGTSSFGAHCSATGGAAGEGSAGSGISNFNAGGLGGNGAGGDLNLAGGDGGNGCRANGEIIMQGYGGDSYFSGGTRAAAATQGGNGLNGGNYGGGGSGGHNRPSQATARSGGSGGDGIVIVTVY